MLADRREGNGAKGCEGVALSASQGPLCGSPGVLTKVEFRFCYNQVGLFSLLEDCNIHILTSEADVGSIRPPSNYLRN